MNSQHSFSAVIEGAEGGGAFVTVPFDVEATFGKKRVKVTATFDGVSYRGSVVRMGGDAHILLVRKDVRTAIGKGVGDCVAVTLAEDTEPRTLNPPEDFLAALEARPDALHSFQALSYSHQRQYVQWITEAKRPQTRAKRIEMLENTAK